MKAIVPTVVVTSVLGLLIPVNHVQLRADDPALAPPSVATAELPEMLVAEARRMIAEYPDTRYSHKTHVDRSQGIADVDCSGFLVFILKHKVPRHLESITTIHKRALAEDFYNAFSPKQGNSATGWKPVPRLAEAQPGDVLAWVKSERMPGDNTGHVMLIAEKPVPESPERYRVRIFDSTLHGHANDERTTAGRSGIGQGTLWIDVDAQGRPSGYRWKSRTGMLHTAPIAIGRPVPIPS
jgi:hypothetical protein